jgi:hypothetical protein
MGLKEHDDVLPLRSGSFRISALLLNVVLVVDQR